MKTALAIFIFTTLLLLAPPSRGQGAPSPTPPRGEDTFHSHSPEVNVKESVQTPGSPGPRPISSEQEYELLKIKALQDTEDDLVKWAQTRFWIAAVLFLGLGFFGVPALVRQMLNSEVKEAMRASADAQAAAVTGHEAIREVRAEAAKYKELVETLSTTAKGLDEQFREIASRIDAESERTSAGADLKISALDQQINQIREMISRLAAETRHEAQDWAQHQRTIEEVRESAATSEAVFADNSRFRVLVVGALPVSETPLGNLTSFIVNALSQKGFKARVGIYSADEPHGVIRIDHDESAKAKAQEVAKIVEDAVAKGKFPQRNIQVGQRPQFKNEDPIRVFL
jgi:hypothetical protein